MIPVVADADTLFGTTTRGLLIHLDYLGLIRLHWSVSGKHYAHTQTVNLVTKNIRDFGVRKLAELGVEVSRPDDFLLALFERDATGVAAAFAALRATLRSAPTPEALLERLAADGQVQTATAMRVAMQRKAVHPIPAPVRALADRHGGHRPGPLDHLPARRQRCVPGASAPGATRGRLALGGSRPVERSSRATLSPVSG